MIEWLVEHPTEVLHWTVNLVLLSYIAFCFFFTMSMRRDQKEAKLKSAELDVEHDKIMASYRARHEQLTHDIQERIIGSQPEPREWH